MKKIVNTLLSVAALITLAFAAPGASAEEVPSWAQPQIDKLGVSDLTDEQKTDIVEAIKIRGAAVKEATESGAEGEDLKAQTREAWSVYVRRMREILNAEQFEKFEESRKPAPGKSEE